MHINTWWVINFLCGCLYFQCQRIEEMSGTDISVMTFFILNYVSVVVCRSFYTFIIGHTEIFEASGILNVDRILTNKLSHIAELEKPHIIIRAIKMHNPNFKMWTVHQIDIIST